MKPDKEVTIPDKARKPVVSSHMLLKRSPFIATTTSIEIQKAPEKFADRKAGLNGSFYNRKSATCNRDIHSGKSSFIKSVASATWKKEVKSLADLIIKVIPGTVKLFLYDKNSTNAS